MNDNYTAIAIFVSVCVIVPLYAYWRNPGRTEEIKRAEDVRQDYYKQQAEHRLKRMKEEEEDKRKTSPPPEKKKEETL